MFYKHISTKGLSMLLVHRIVVFVLIGLLPIPAMAADDDLLQLLNMLKDSNSLNQKQYQVMITAIEDKDHGNEDDVVMVSSQGGLKLSSYDGQFSFELGGRLMIDMAVYQEDTVTLGNGTELRRARLEAEGVIYSNWGYELGVDFAGADVEVKDAYIEYLGKFDSSTKMGQFKEPFSLEELTSSNYITFMERALPNEFAPGRNIGIGLTHLGESWTVAYGLFAEAFDDDVADEGDEGWGVTARFTYAPWHEDRKALHMGVALSQRTPDDDNTVKFDSRPESHITDVKYLDTGDIMEVDRVTVYGLEAALVLGSMSLQAELINAQVARTGGLDDLGFSGGYVYGSWFLTGESRIYKHSKGSFGRINPVTDAGAWELALRLSTLDLNDLDISGGKTDQLTLGINWYVNPRLRYMLNFVKVDNDLAADGGAPVVAGDDDPEIIQIRAQIDF
ncbi:MAG: OprO/OprP family phosphate-selective porin [Gammaproteobacteria bacterium]